MVFCAIIVNFNSSCNMAWSSHVLGPLRLWLQRRCIYTSGLYTNSWRLHFRAIEVLDFRLHFRAASMQIKLTSGLHLPDLTSSSKLHDFMSWLHVVDFRPLWQKSRSFEKNQGRKLPGKGRKFPGKGRKKPVIFFDLFIFNELQGS